MTQRNDNHWTLIGSREIYRNPWIRVREDQVLRPDAKPGIYGVVEFQTVALGIVPVDENGDTVLVGQYRYTLGQYSWELPEGGGAKGIDPLEEARRELVEETGISASAWTDLGQFHLSNSVTDESGRIYLAQGLSFGEQRPDGDEVLRTWRLPLIEAHAMCMDGRITDAVSIIGITRAVSFLPK
ncbi:MAG: NUDIX hydrolase [Capsulimonadaceae bacterium]|nr:NUDIX hydrolase [Capsulimonadaceae bacterium]